METKLNLLNQCQPIYDLARGVDGVEVDLIAITPEQIEGERWKDDEVMVTLSVSDAIIFGAPTYMGMASGLFKCFADATAPYWFDQSWKGKLAGGFTRRVALRATR